jgi:hypothetical protein
LLESRVVRPRQARYQAALRPDMKYMRIIKDFPTERLCHLTERAGHAERKTGYSKRGQPPVADPEFKNGGSLLQV